MHGGGGGGVRATAAGSDCVTSLLRVAPGRPCGDPGVLGSVAGSCWQWLFCARRDVTVYPLVGGHNKKDPREWCCQVENGSGRLVGTAGRHLRSFPLIGRQERLEFGRVSPRCQTRLEGTFPGKCLRRKVAVEPAGLASPAMAGQSEGSRPAHPSGIRSCSAPLQAGGGP